MSKDFLERNKETGLPLQSWQRFSHDAITNKQTKKNKQKKQKRK